MRPLALSSTDGKVHWLADGFHRTRAAQRAGIDVIACVVRKGTQRDAILYSAGANETHGKRRTNADKHQAVMTLLADAEWSKKSDRWIAEKCAVSDFLVRGLRVDATASSRSSQSREGKDGKTRKQPARAATSAEGLRPATSLSLVPPQPQAVFDSMAACNGTSILLSHPTTTIHRVCRVYFLFVAHSGLIMRATMLA